MVTFVDDSGAWLRPDLFVLIELRAIARQLLEAVVHGEPRGLLLDEAVALHGKVRVDREVGGMKKYDPLHRWLNSQTDAEVSVSLQEIERIIGRRLPASARERPAWWANVQDRSRKWFCARPICNDSPLSARS